MKLQDIKDMDKDQMLGLLGLETKRTDTSRLFRTLGTFGIGLLVGAGVALLLAPKAGSELRQNLRAKLRRDAHDGLANGSEEGDAREEASRHV